MAESGTQKADRSANDGRYALPCWLERYSLGSFRGRLSMAETRFPLLVRRYFTVLVLLPALSAGGCRRDPVFTEISDSTYIKTMVALRRLPVGSIDSTSRARQRDSILKAFGVTAKQLEDIAVRLAEDERAAAIFRAIENPTVSSPP
jgi:hypothetical protein